MSFGEAFFGFWMVFFGSIAVMMLLGFIIIAIGAAFKL